MLQIKICSVVLELEDLSYKERLNTLERRMLRSNYIEVYKIMLAIDKVESFPQSRAINKLKGTGLR